MTRAAGMLSWIIVDHGKSIDEGVTMVEQRQFKASSIKPLISREEVEKVNIRVGTIERVEDVPRSHTLVETHRQLWRPQTLDLGGNEKRKTRSKGGH